MLTQSDLDGFTGTSEYFPHWTRKLVFTEGVKYLADKAGAYWLIDAIASYQADPRIAKNQMLRRMQFWKLEVQGDKAVLTVVEDSGRKPVISQNIDYTDFPLKSVEIWVEYGGYETEHGVQAGFVAMLPSER